jgi:CheY-like chemotaxis protein
VKTILFVDDSKFQRLVHERMLVKAGYRVLTAADGDEAVRVAFAEVPDLVILDMLLPKMPGPEVLSKLRKNAATSAVPVIVLSSMAQKNESKLIELGANAYMEKSKLDSGEGSGLFLELVRKELGGEEGSQKKAATVGGITVAGGAR